MLRMSFVFALSLVAPLAACKKQAKDEPTPSAAAPATALAGDGVRRVPVEAALEGYKPDTISGKPGEKLVLVFTRTVDGTCMAQVKSPDGKLVELPKGKSVDVPVTVPETGEVKFACGMDMVFGKIVADKS